PATVPQDGGGTLPSQTTADPPEVATSAPAFHPAAAAPLPQDEASTVPATTAGSLPAVGGPSGPLHHGHRGNSRCHPRSGISPAHREAGLDRFGVHKGNRPAQTEALGSALLRPVRNFPNRL